MAPPTESGAIVASLATLLSFRVAWLVLVAEKLGVTNRGVNDGSKTDSFDAVLPPAYPTEYV